MYFFFYNNCFATTCACNTVLIFYSFHAILSQIIFITVHKISVHKAIWHNKKHLQVWKICGREIIDNSDLLVDEYVMVIFFITTFFILAWLFVVCSFRNLGKMHRGTNIADFQVTLRMLHRQPFFFFCRNGNTFFFSLPKWLYLLQMVYVQFKDISILKFSLHQLEQLELKFVHIFQLITTVRWIAGYLFNLNRKIFTIIPLFFKYYLK